MRGPPELDAVLAHPRTLEATVEPRFIDAMGHMNIAWYMFLFDRASWAILARIGLDDAQMQRAGSGAFAVEQTVRYFAELRVGARIDVHTQMLAIGGKSVRFIHTMLDVDERRVAATVDTVAVHVDRRTRRAVPFPDAMIGSAQELIDPAPCERSPGLQVARLHLAPGSPDGAAARAPLIVRPPI